MARRPCRVRLNKRLLLISACSMLTGAVILLMAWLPLQQIANREILTHTGTLETCYTETHPNGRSTSTYYCFVVNDETYYVSPIVWRALDRGSLAALVPGTQLRLSYWADMPARQLERNTSSRELLSIESDSQVYMTLEACLQEKKANGQIGMTLGSIFLLVGLAMPITEMGINRFLFQSRIHKKRQ